VINKYLGDSGHTGSKINCNMAGHIANPEKIIITIQIETINIVEIAIERLHYYTTIF